MSTATFSAAEYDPDDYDALESIAALAARIFKAESWQYKRDSKPYVPDETKLAATIQHLYEMHRNDGEPKALTSTGRFVLVDENPHDGTPVLHEGIRVFLDLGELPPHFGDEEPAA